MRKSTTSLYTIKNTSLEILRQIFLTLFFKFLYVCVTIIYVYTKCVPSDSRSQKEGGLPGSGIAVSHSMWVLETELFSY